MLKRHALGSLPVPQRIAGASASFDSPFRHPLGARANRSQGRHAPASSTQSAWIAAYSGAGSRAVTSRTPTRDASSRSERKLCGLDHPIRSAAAGFECNSTSSRRSRSGINPKGRFPSAAAWVRLVYMATWPIVSLFWNRSEILLRGRIRSCRTSSALGQHWNCWDE